MKKQYISKVLPALALASLLAFIYVNFDAQHLSVNLKSGQASTEQTHIGDDTDRKSEKDTEHQAIGSGTLSKVLGIIAHHFLPVSNHIAE